MSLRRRARRQVAAMGVAAVVVLVGTAAACGGDGDDGRGGGGPADTVLFATHGNALVAYSMRADLGSQVVIPSRSQDPEGWDVSGQPCFFPDGSRRFVIGEHTGRPDPPPGWAVFQLEGDRVGSFTATRLGRLVPTYQGGPQAGDPTACAFLADGRILTTDAGAPGAQSPSGQLIVWFPPFDEGSARSCKIDVAIGSAQALAVFDGDRVFVASADEPTAGVLLYEGPFPSGPDERNGCSRIDATGAGMSDSVRRTHLIPADEQLPGAHGLAPAPDGGLYVSSATAGVINQYDRLARYLRTILQPLTPGPPGPEGPSGGTPVSLTVDGVGDVYYADAALVGGPAGPRPAAGEGSVRVIRFVSAVPQAPVTVDDGLESPDGLAVLLVPG